jgi:hypothetical protein
MKVVRRAIVAVFLVFALVAPCFVAGQIPPSIISQPQDQTVDYGSDDSFTVAATGTEPLTYQWWNGDHMITDYDDNAAGARTPTLYLIGVGQQDASWEGNPSYHVVISNAAGAITSYWAGLTVRPKIVLQDNFENELSQWSPLLDGAPLSIDNSQNHTQNGFLSAAIANTSQKMFARLNPKQPDRVRLTFWLYDAGGPQQALGELRSYTGESGYGKYIWRKKGLWQCFSAGIYTTDFGTNNTGILADETLDPTKYQGRVMTGTNTGWFNLNAEGVPSRTTGWHQFQIDRSRSTNVDFYVDGVLARTITGTKEGTDVDTVTIGSTGVGEFNQIPISPTSAWFDDVTVDAFQNNSSHTSLAAQGVIPQLMQLRETGTNSSVTDLWPSTVCELSGAATNKGIGTWIITNSDIAAGDVRGYLEYELDAPANNAYRVEIEGREENYKWPAAALKLKLWLDGEDLGSVDLPYGQTSNGLAHCITPFIQTGTHRLGILWDNAHPRCELLVHAVRLQALTGGAKTKNGMSMWVANRLLVQSGMDSPPDSSPVSPVCLEGRGQYLSMMNLSAGAEYPLTQVPVFHGVGNRWFANVPLSPLGPMHVEASYQNGGLTESNDIGWEATDLLDATNMVIREGDSLLLTALPQGAANGMISVQVEGQNPVQTDGSAPVPIQFTNAGTYKVTGLYEPTGESGSIQVTVVNASFDGPCPANLSVWWSWWTYWDCTNLPPGVVFDTDSRLKILPVSAADRAARLPNAPPLGTNGQEFEIEPHVAEPRYVLARLGTNGPILAQTAVLGYQFAAPPTSSFRVVTTRSDGSQLIEATYVLSPRVPNFGLNVSIVTAGVTFEDGTLTKTLTSADFDELGVCRVNFIRASGVEAGTCMLLTFEPETR